MSESDIFYVSALSPFGARVRLVAKATGIDPGVQTPPPGGTGSDAFKEISPFGQLPAISTGGFMLVESLSIMEYLIEISGDSALLPASPLARARIRGIALAHDHQVIAAMRPIFGQVRKPDADPAVIQAGFADVTSKLSTLARLFDAAGPAIGGTLSLADLAIAPFQVLTTYLAARFGIESPYASVPRLADWCAEMRAVPVIAADAERQNAAIAAAFG